MNITANEFWDFYFKNRFIRLRRTNKGYEGEVYTSSPGSLGPMRLLKKPSQKQVDIQLSDLNRYNYEKDGRFYLIAAYPKDVTDAYRMIRDDCYPYRAPAPFGRVRMSELFQMIATDHLLRPEALIHRIDIEQLLQSFLQNYSEPYIQPMAALAWFLGERRSLSSADILLSLIRRSNYVQKSSAPPVHFSIVNASLEALWKINPKTKTPELIDMMRSMNPAGKAQIAALFERLLSTKNLLSRHHLQSDYLNENYWSTTYSNMAVQDWNCFDLNALFWELRYVAVTRIANHQSELLKAFAQDEVQTVAKLAQSKLNSLAES